MARKARHATLGVLCLGMIAAMISPLGNACTSDSLADLTDIPLPEPREDVQVVLGVASWYSEVDPGVPAYTASGRRFDSSQLWAASWDYPLGTRLRVTRPRTARSVEVVVMDRGPAEHLNRTLDLTKAAFSRIAHPGEGIINVEITQISD